MSAFYLLGVFAVWVALTVFIAKQWRNRRKRAEAGRGSVDAGFALIALVWLAASFWFGGGQKFYWDYQVNKLCAIDGGIKVYERVTLPAERFDKYGNIGLRTQQYAKPKDEYYLDMKDIDVKTGEVSIVKHIARVIRRGDVKVIGESIHYGRGGGDLPGPWHPSSYTCPALDAQLGLERSIFIKEQK